MFLTRKYVCRGLRRYRWKVLPGMFLCTAVYLLYLWTNSRTHSFLTHCDPIDAVYTWVNGSDPSFIQSLLQYGDHYDKSRFDDKNELKYSLRSLERYAPWIRHVYIVTNGQIPKWLDLSNEHVTVVPHEILAPNLDLLPTFSSAAIETFLSRIPNLSKRFLYLNDDIFLGSELYPEDLYTDSDGVRIYQAWLVPDCAEDCPWTYIGDGTCDRHCNIPECQYDGNDCLGSASDKPQRVVVHKAPIQTEIKEFPKRRRHMASDNLRASKFRDVLRVNQRNMTQEGDVKSIVDTYNKKLQQRLQSKEAIANKEEILHKQPTNKYNDDYMQSLIYTNMLLNRRYGFKARHVISHVGFLLEKPIIEAMQREFALETVATASQRFRSPNDLQFSFAYYSFLMEETNTVRVTEIFDEFDTDHSHTWSDREIRTLLARMFPLPLDWSAVQFFENVVKNCCLTHCPDVDKNKQYTTLLYERYEDSNLPTINREFVQQCLPLAEALEANFGTRSTYKHHINPKRNVYNNFVMLTSNVTDVVIALDSIRRNPRKFNCINDNLNAQRQEENTLIRHLLEDFFLSLLPHRSKFELQPQYRNRFKNWIDYLKWHRQQRAFLVLIYGTCIIFIAYVMRSVCKYKAKFVRQFVNVL